MLAELFPCAMSVARAIEKTPQPELPCSCENLVSASEECSAWCIIAAICSFVSGCTEEYKLSNTLTQDGETLLLWSNDNHMLSICTNGSFVVGKDMFWPSGGS